MKLRPHGLDKRQRSIRSGLLNLAPSDPFRSCAKELRSLNNNRIEEVCNVNDLPDSKQYPLIIGHKPVLRLMKSGFRASNSKANDVELSY